MNERNHWWTHTHTHAPAAPLITIKSHTIAPITQEEGEQYQNAQKSKEECTAKFTIY